MVFRQVNSTFSFHCSRTSSLKYLYSLSCYLFRIHTMRRLCHLKLLHTYAASSFAFLDASIANIKKEVVAWHATNSVPLKITLRVSVTRIWTRLRWFRKCHWPYLKNIMISERPRHDLTVTPWSDDCIIICWSRHNQTAAPKSADLTRICRPYQNLPAVTSSSNRTSR